MKDRRTVSGIAFCAILGTAYVVAVSISARYRVSAAVSHEFGPVIGIREAKRPLSTEEYSYVRTELHAAYLSALAHRPTRNPVVRCLDEWHAAHLLQEVRTLIERGNYVRLIKRLPKETGGFYEQNDTLFIEVVAEEQLVVLAFLRKSEDAALFESLKTCAAARVARNPQRSKTR